MAATVAASKAYDLAGGALREDLRDIIYDISPMDTIFLTKAGRGTAKSTTHELSLIHISEPTRPY